jgi:DMSO/TMAO reductase YedYZ molybdopterin-dependent catalytic subunit
VDKLGLTGTPIEVDIKTYRLVVDGLVERPLSLSYAELLAYPTVSQVLKLDCPGFFVDYAEWSGPLVRTLLEEAGVKPEATAVEFSEGGDYPYSKTLTLEEARRDDTLLAYQVNGVTLPVEHGYPVRLAVGSELGSYWVKWLFRIEVQ